MACDGSSFSPANYLIGLSYSKLVKVWRKNTPLPFRSHLDRSPYESISLYPLHFDMMILNLFIPLPLRIYTEIVERNPDYYFYKSFARFL